MTLEQQAEAALERMRAVTGTSDHVINVRFGYIACVWADMFDGNKFVHGKGDTPDSAVEDLLAKVEDNAHRIKRLREELNRLEAR